MTYTYKNYQRNHAIIPGREKALEDFLNQDYKGMRHKWKNGISSNSEDALTWSCFELLEHFPLTTKISVLDEIMEDSFQGKCNFNFKDKSYMDNDIKIFIGKQYTGQTTNESTEVDASIESPDKLIFVEAKLYSPLSLADKTKNKPHDQIARKLRVGLDSCADKDFYFIFLDIAPASKLILRKSKSEALEPNKSGFYDKWKSAWWFNYYKQRKTPLRNILDGIKYKSEIAVADNMGWLTWSDLYKDLLRSILTDKLFSGR
jgi:hypothetical protein